MKKTKTFLISFNQLTTDFWKQHLNFENTQLFHWKVPEHGINNINTVWPDVIIIDSYFSNSSFELLLKKVLKQTSNSQIFFLTPAPKPHGKMMFIHDRLKVSKLDEEVINQINWAINPIQEEKQLNQTA